VNDPPYELLSVYVGDVFVAVTCHTPKPVNSTESLQGYIESCMADITDSRPVAQIIIVGDVIQPQELAVIERTGLVQTVQQPKHGATILN
jgi:hypothetical protein